MSHTILFKHDPFSPFYHIFQIVNIPSTKKPY